jgi:hypothetical protein
MVLRMAEKIFLVAIRMLPCWRAAPPKPALPVFCGIVWLAPDGGAEIASFDLRSVAKRVIEMRA